MMITIEGIEQAVSGLQYHNAEALKYKLIHTIWGHYRDLDGVQTPERIDADSLIKALWGVDDDAALQGKKRNLSSTKSAVNRDLKTAYRDGRNPEGIVIGRHNVFVLSDEAKDDLLSAVDLGGAKETAASVKRIREALETIRGALFDTDGETASARILDSGVRGELLDTIGGLSAALGLDGTCPGEPSGEGGSESIGESAEPSQVEATRDDGLLDTQTSEVAPEEDIIEEILEDMPEDEILDEASDEGFDIVPPGGEDTDGTGEQAPSVGLPREDLLDPDFDETQEDQDPRLLAEAFDGYLGAMERYYNQYLLIPEGNYAHGDPLHEAWQTPASTIALAAFYMGKFPVTNALFEVFVERTGYVTLAEEQGHSTVYHGRLFREKDKATGRIKYRSTATIRSLTVPGACWYRPTGPGSTLHQKRNHPVVHVALDDALAFAAWTGKRLPTEAEWEAAARTQRGLVFPWGNEWKGGTCNIEDEAIGDTTPVNAFKAGENELGIADTLGNVLEWTSDISPGTTESLPAERHQILKGGSWTSQPGVRLTNRFKMDPQFTSNVVGFRCAVD